MRGLGGCLTGKKTTRNFFLLFHTACAKNEGRGKEGGRGGGRKGGGREGGERRGRERRGRERRRREGAVSLTLQSVPVECS